jgi:hypothetical protein
MTLGFKKTLVAIALFAVSAAMVYGTWLAVDDMRAKPMVARVSVEGAAVVVVNDGDFAWSDAQFVVNGTFRAAAPDTLAPGARQAIALTAFVDRDGRTAASAGDPVRDITATATRHSRFGTFNTDRPTTGRWLLGQTR